VSEGVEGMGNENSDAKKNKKSGYSFKHGRILRNPFTKRPTFCTVKEIPVSGLNFPRGMMISSNIAPRNLERSPRLMVVLLPAS
jgi:hypothetical protein